MLKQFDVIVIGSGGGSKITRPAANLGNKVAIIEKDQLGGTCLNRGCIPSKMLIHPADIIREIQDAKRFHIELDESFKFDSERLVSEVSAEVSAESESIEPLYEAHENITFYHETAVFEEDYVIRVGGDLITAPKIFIAAGARPTIPNYTGLTNTPYWTSTEALKATQLPESLIIFGGGYIACELGHYFSSMGVKVTFIVRSELLRQQDDDIKREYKNVAEKHCEIIEQATVTDVSYDQQQFTVSYHQDNIEHSVSAKKVLVAAGITANTDTLGLDKTAIDEDQNGFIKVDQYLETSLKGVYSFGDIIGRYFFRHTANYEGQYLFESIFASDKRLPIKYKPVPYAMFTAPQIAGVGLSEEDCKKQQIEYVLGKNSYAASAMGMALRSDHGFVKLLFDRQSKKLIGAHIIGREASNMIHMLIAFMVMNASHQDLLDTIYIHPALPEIVRNAARNCSF